MNRVKRWPVEEGARQLLRLGRNTIYHARLRQVRHQMAWAIEQAEGRALRP